jgi:hypothetical protein
MLSRGMQSATPAAVFPKANVAWSNMQRWTEDTTVIWRGFSHLADLVEGTCIAANPGICGVTPHQPV